MRLKQLIILLGATSFISIASFSNLYAQSSDDYLKIIAQNTTDMLSKLDKIPELINGLSEMVLAWITPMTSDNSPPLQNMQTSITQLGDLIVQGQTKQQSMLMPTNFDLLNNDGTNVYNSNNGTANTAQSMSNLNYANDLTYSTMLGMPVFARDPRNKAGAQPVNSAYNYIKNAAGLNIYHPIPNPSWKEGKSKKRYQNYFNTVMAVESFDSYILSNQLADGNQLNELQKTLVNQASDPSAWIAQVASEKIGFVLRQILLYQSQLFILMTQMVQSEKQMVTAQAMTNSLLIAINQINENTMIANAQGVAASTD